MHVIKKVMEFYISFLFFLKHLGPTQAFEDLKKATHQKLLRHPNAL